MRGRRRRIGVPRGLLRYLTFQFLNDEPMSGSEIVDKIEEYSGWRPSPGSIYPLLSHMEEVGLIKPLEDQDPTLKRFELTEIGEKHIEEMTVYDEQIISRHRVFRKVYWRLHLGVPDDLYDSLRELLDTFQDSYCENQSNLNVQKQLKAVLDSAVEKLGRLN